MSNRRTTHEALTRILDAGSPEELFTGPQGEAVLLYGLLVDATRGRDSPHYGDLCRVARHRGVTPEYVVDRAIVLLAAMRERRRLDLYRILGVPPLASGDVIRQRWLEVAKLHHPDLGGDGTVFRHAKQAYEVLRDPGRRAEYEHFWMRALGPFARVTPEDEGVRYAPPPAPDVTAPPPEVAAHETEIPPVPPEPPREVPVPPAPAEDSLRAAAALFEEHGRLDQTLEAASTMAAGGVGGLITRVEEALRPIDRASLERLTHDVEALIGQLETLRSELSTLATLKKRLRA